MYVKKKIATHLYETNPQANAFEIEDILSKLPLYQDIQIFCQEYLARKLVVAPVIDNPLTYRFTLMNDAGNEFYLDDLSAGEKSMLGIICAVY